MNINILKVIRSALEITLNKIQTIILSHSRISRSGINFKMREIPVVVSLTSFPGRINIVHKTIKTILMQSYKPDKVILWLADEQFVNREIPKSLLNLVRYGLEIMWCEDIRSYKKLVPTLELFPNAIIVTADDDNYYSRNWLDKLMKSYKQHPNVISAHKVTKFSWDKKWIWNAGGRDYYHTPTFLNKLVGVGGVLYPPGCLYKDVIRKDLFMRLAPTNDDQWFWFMAIMKKTPIAVVEKPIIHTKPVEGTLKDGLWKVNDCKDGFFEKQFVALLDYYPEVDEMLKKEYIRMQEAG